MRSQLIFLAERDWFGVIGVTPIQSECAIYDLLVEWVAACAVVCSRFPRHDPWLCGTGLSQDARRMVVKRPSEGSRVSE